MPSLSLAFVIVFISLLVGCTGELAKDAELVGPQDAGGPGLFSGPEGEFSVNKILEGNDERKRGGGYYILDLEGAPPINEDEFKEFERFKAWLRSKEEGTLEYKEYEQWRAFQQYRQQQAN